MRAMREIRAGLVALVAFWAAPVTAEALDAKALSAKVQTYYGAPDAVAAFGWLLQADLPEATRDTVKDYFGVFYGRILMDNPATAAGLVQRMAAEATPAQAEIAARAVGLWNPPDRDRHLATLDARAGRPLTRMAAMPDLKTGPVSDPGLFDLCWASFFATGDRVYVWRLADNLIKVEGQDTARKNIQKLNARIKAGDQEARAEAVQIALMSALGQSLESHAAAHRKVAEALRDYAREHLTRSGKKAREMAERHGS